jgi:ubiquinone biosynthesis protein COQ9
MEAVKRAKSVQQKSFITSYLSFAPTQMFFNETINETVKELTVGEYLSSYLVL